MLYLWTQTHRSTIYLPQDKSKLGLGFRICALEFGWKRRAWNFEKTSECTYLKSPLLGTLISLEAWTRRFDSSVRLAHKGLPGSGKEPVG